MPRIQILPNNHEFTFAFCIPATRLSVLKFLGLRQQNAFVNSWTGRTGDIPSRTDAAGVCIVDFGRTCWIGSIAEWLFQSIPKTWLAIISWDQSLKAMINYLPFWNAICMSQILLLPAIDSLQNCMLRQLKSCSFWQVMKYRNLVILRSRARL